MPGPMPPEYTLVISPTPCPLPFRLRLVLCLFDRAKRVEKSASTREGTISPQNGVPPNRRTRVPVLCAVALVAVRQRPILAVGARKAASYGFIDNFLVRLFGEVG